ncbi:MAG: sulfur carrier protein ThiS [Pseudomonadota bacterium]
MIEIQLNGETRALHKAATITDLLAEIGIAPVKVAVERNLEIVPKSLFSQTPLHAGDRIEVVQFVGGG